MTYNMKHESMKQEAVEAIMEALRSGYSGYYCDLHNEVFNTDWYIIGIYEAKEALREYDVFEAMEMVSEYEYDNFGEVFPDDLTKPEKLINMVYYIIGMEVISKMMEDIEVFSEYYDNHAEQEINEIIIEEMEEMFF